MKTVSLELAKQLKEAGFPQESYFFWVQSVWEKNNEFADWHLMVDRVGDMKDRSGRHNQCARPHRRRDI